MSDETGKCKKAKQSLKAMETQVDHVEEKMVEAYNVLIAIDNSGQGEIASGAKIKELGRINIPRNGVNLYIDFCLVSDDNNVEGAIVYGALRKPRYPHSLWPNANVEENWESRPLVCFSVDDLGKISNKGKLDDVWWLTHEGDDSDVTKAVKEMHYRTLDLVWHDALNWVSEPLLP